MDWLDRKNWTAEAVNFLDYCPATHTNIWAGTGHRPPRLGLDYSPASNRNLTEFVQARLENHSPLPDLVISGGAQGFDQALAHAAFMLGIPYVIAQPFAGQADKWPADAQKRYYALLGAAYRVVTVCPGGYEAKKFLARDNFMVEAADGLFALYDGCFGGGTAHTFHYASTLGKRLENMWGSWVGRPV